MSLIGDVVKGFLAKFPNIPNKTLSNLIYHKNPELFTDPESVRTTIRYYKGQNGDKCRAAIADKTFIQDEPNPYNPFDAIPEGLKYFTDWEYYHIKGKKVLVLADVHAPYHNKDALTLALKTGKDYDCDTVFFLGDLTDYHKLSKWETDPRKRNTRYEIDTTRSILQAVRKIFPNAKIIIKEGNHDERNLRYLRVKAPELIELEIFTPEQLFDTEKYGIDVVKEKRVCKIGKYLHLIHGHEFGGNASTSVNPARTLYNLGKDTAICGHWHRTSNHLEPSPLTGKLVSCWSVGCLCDMRVEYRVLNKWNHGFAIIERDGDEFWVHNKMIIDGKVY